MTWPGSTSSDQPTWNQPNGMPNGYRLGSPSLASDWEGMPGRSTVVSVIELQDLSRVVAEELGPHLVLEGYVRKLLHDPIEAESHGEVARVHDLVGAPGVGVVDDR